MSKKEIEEITEEEEEDLCSTKKKKVSSDRVDYMPFESDGPDGSYMTEKMILTDEGYLRGRAIATNVGVFPYLMEDGSVQYELRPPEEVFHPDSVKTLADQIITNDHPTVKVTAENSKELGVGFTGDIHIDQYHLAPLLTITDKSAVQDIQNGKRALSAGYTSDVVMQSGTWMGIHYDAIQTNIRYNHLAIVPRGRAGDAARMKLDSMDSLGIQKIDIKNKKGSVTMPKLRVDGVEYEMSADVLSLYQKKCDELDTVKADSEKTLEATKAELATVTAKADQLEEDKQKLTEDLEAVKKENNAEKIDAAVKAKLSLLNSAQKAGIEIKEDMDDLSIKKEIILSVYPNAKEKLDAHTEDEAYINARLDGAIEALEEKSGNEAFKGDSLKDEKKDEQKEDGKEEKTERSSDDARLDMINNLKNRSGKKEE